MTISFSQHSLHPSSCCLCNVSICSTVTNSKRPSHMTFFSALFVLLRSTATVLNIISLNILLVQLNGENMMFVSVVFKKAVQKREEEEFFFYKIICIKRIHPFAQQGAQNKSKQYVRLWNICMFCSVLTAATLYCSPEKKKKRKKVS